ncbi:hypothetical protein Tco_0462797 [Tanacetum coccineum]
MAKDHLNKITQHNQQTTRDFIKPFANSSLALRSLRVTRALMPLERDRDSGHDRQDKCRWLEVMVEISLDSLSGIRMDIMRSGGGNVGNQVVSDAVSESGVQSMLESDLGLELFWDANQNCNQIENGMGHLARNCTNQTKMKDGMLSISSDSVLIDQTKEEAGIPILAEVFVFMDSVEGDLDEIEEVDANCILMANLQQASTSGTQSDKAPVYDSDGSAEVHNCYDNEIFNMFTQEEHYTDLLEPIPEPHQVQQNDINVISDVPCVEHGGGTVEQCPATVKETRALYDSLYNNLAIEVENVNSVNQNLKATNVVLTTELARYKNQEKCFEISQEKYDKLERSLNEEISNLNKQLSKEKSTVSSLLEEKKKLKSDFKIPEDKGS